MTDQQLIVPARFCGPPHSGNGGWTAGSVAEAVTGGPEDHTRTWPTVEVTLRRPPPLDQPLDVAQSDGTTTVSDGDAVVARGRVVDQDPVAVDPVTPVDAAAAEPSYAGFDDHPFTTCFTCGPGREEGDGLRIFPGPVGEGRVAGRWTPHPSVAEDWHTYVDDVRHASVPVTWAALDCVGGWTGDLIGRPMVLGRITARLATLPVIGEEHVVVGEWRGAEGRKMWTASALYDSDGREVARAEHVWIAVDIAKFS